MTIVESILPEFESEMANTRKVLALIPDENLDWKAHEKSFSIGQVSAHLADIPGWVELTLKRDEMDVNPKNGEPYRTPPLLSRQAVVDHFDAKVATAKDTLRATADEEFGRSWTLLSGGEPLFTMPKLACIRTWVLNHTIHHRAHLCVYLRLNDIPVPGMYGPSADDTPPQDDSS